MKIGLVIKRTAGYAKLVPAALEGADIAYTKTTLKALAAGTQDGIFDLLVLDGSGNGVLKALRDGKIRRPVILLVEPGVEAQAVELLQRHVIADYLLTTRSQIERLPLVIRAVAARGTLMGTPPDSGGTQPDAAQMGVLQDAVYQIARAADEAESLEALLPKIHEIVGRVMPARNFYIALYNAARQTLNFEFFVDEVDTLASKELDVGNGLTAYVLRNGKSLLIANAAQRAMLRNEGVEGVGTPSAIWLGVPLFVDKIPIGVMAVQHYEDDSVYGETEQKMLEFVSSQVAMVIRRQQTYDALRTSEESLRSVFENANVGIVRLTPDGQIVFANPVMIRMLGFNSMDELRGRNPRLEEFMHKYFRRGLIERLAKDQLVRGFESEWIRGDGTPMYVRQSGRAVRGMDGQTIYYEGIVEDITERKQAELTVQEKVHALESLAEIDREILAAEDAHSILNLVCERIALLLKAPKSVILTKDSVSGQVILAHYGFSPEADLAADFEIAAQNGLLDQHLSLSLSGLKRDDLHLAEVIRREDIQALVSEGFSSSEDVQGALLIFDSIPRNWSRDEIQLVRLLAGQSALALAKIRLFTDARRRAQQFEGLYQIAGELMARRDLPSLLRMIVQKASELHDVPSAFIYLYDEKAEDLELSIVHGLEMELGARVGLGEGMTGRVAQTLELMMVDDYSTWEHRLQSLDGNPFRAILEVPMIYQGHLVGVLGIAETRDPRRRFSEEDIRLLSLFAEQASSVLYNSRLFAQIEDRNRELDRLSRASATLLESISGDIQTACTSIANLLASEFNFSNCSIWLIRENSTLLEPGALAGPFADQMRSVPMSLEGPGIIAKSIRTGQIIYLPDVHASPDYKQSWEKTRSELVVPFRSGERILGAIDLQSEELSAYTLDDQRLIELIASRAALMLDRVRLYQQTERRLGQLTVLSNIDSAIASSLDLQVTLNLLVAQLSTHLQADAVSVLLLNPHLQMLEYAAGRGFRGQAIRRVSLLLGEDQAGAAALERRVVSAADVSSPQVVLRHPERIAGENFESMFAIPLIAKGQVRGVIEIYFRRPVESDPEWTHFLEILARQAAVAVEDARLFNEMQRSYTELTVAYDAAIEGWSKIIQLRQRESEDMLRRLIDLTVNLARRMGITQEQMANVYRGVLLHDIGKLAVPESILHKSGELTNEEWDLVHRHPVYAYDLLKNIPYLRASVSIPYCHQENWDGSGYPRGLQGEEIPLEARIFAVVNAWLKLQYDRPYARATSAEFATVYIKKQAGQEFDPQVVETFCKLLEELKTVREPNVFDPR